MFGLKNISSHSDSRQSHEHVPFFQSERVFTGAFFSLLLAGSIPCMIGGYQGFLNAEWALITELAILYAFIAVLVFYKRIPLRIRVCLAVLVFYFSGVYVLFSSGGVGYAMVFFICFSALGGILGGVRAGAITLGMNSIALVFSNFLSQGPDQFRQDAGVFLLSMHPSRLHWPYGQAGKPPLFPAGKTL